MPAKRRGKGKPTRGAQGEGGSSGPGQGKSRDPTAAPTQLNPTPGLPQGRLKQQRCSLGGPRASREAWRRLEAPPSGGAASAQLSLLTSGRGGTQPAPPSPPPGQGPSRGRAGTGAGRGGARRGRLLSSARPRRAVPTSSPGAGAGAGGVRLVSSCLYQCTQARHRGARGAGVRRVREREKCV